jgi:hypothetical protein
MPLSADEHAAITNLIEPLPPAVRGPFVAAVEAALEGREHGPGVAHRIAVSLRPSYFSPPPVTHQPQFFNSRKQHRDR